MEQASTASCFSEVNLSKIWKITVHGQISGAYLSFRNHLWEKIKGVQVELRDTESKVYQVERFGLLLNPDFTIAVLTGKEDDSSSYPSIPRNCLENMSPQGFRYGMSCLDPNQNDTTWVSKTVGRLAILDYCINPENMKSELALFPVARNQYVLDVVKMNHPFYEQEYPKPRQFIFVKRIRRTNQPINHQNFKEPRYGMWYNNHLRFNNQLTSTSAVSKIHKYIQRLRKTHLGLSKEPTGVLREDSDSIIF